MVMLWYNFMSTKKILAFCDTLQALENCKPKYRKVVCVLKMAPVQAICSSNSLTFFFIFIWRLFFDASLKPPRKDYIKLEMRYMFLG